MNPPIKPDSGPPVPRLSEELPPALAASLSRLFETIERRNAAERAQREAEKIERAERRRRPLWWRD